LFTASFRPLLMPASRRKSLETQVGGMETA
jgi:hypothetical protein